METLFHNIPNSEDTVTYSIYFPPFASDQITFLKETSTFILSELNQYLDKYIWQKDSFQLIISKNESDPGYSFLHGKTRFGDCIDDEWFIVFLLRQISLKYKDTVISVSDNDGEFLLIEAAKHLPSWLDPNNSENRVFIYRNELHIIPLPKTPAEILNIPTGKLSIDKALELIRNDNFNTKADINVQLAAFERPNEFPQKIQQNIHRARCHIPRGVAHVLYQNPQLVAPAVEAFYTRDPIALKACQKMENFPPSTSITVSVKFTKILYAQMVSQKFYPPKPFKLPASTSKNFKAAELGMKLSCGFEILCTDKHYTAKSSKMNIETYPFDEDLEWKLFHNNLIKRDYYCGKVEGSEKYKQLNIIAKKQYLINKSETMDDEESSNCEPTPSEQINHLLRNPMFPDEVSTENSIEDDDSWINIDHKQLEELLNKREKGYEETRKESMDEQGNPVDLTSMIGAFEKFIDFEGSGIGGAEFLDERTSDDDDDDDMEVDHEESDDMNNNDVNLDPTKFLNIMRQTLGISEEEYRKLAVAKLKQGKAETTNDKIMSVIVQENQQQNTHPTAPISIEQETDEDLDMKAYMQAMETELSSSKIPESFIYSSDQLIGRKQDAKNDLSSKKGKGKTTDSTNINSDEGSDELYKPVDINLNLVKNLLESFKSQEGLPGPVSNIFNRLGNVLPKDEEDESNEDVTK